jgi:hypothetical protein
VQRGDPRAAMECKAQGAAAKALERCGDHAGPGRTIGRNECTSETIAISHKGRVWQPFVAVVWSGGVLNVNEVKR